MIKRDVLQPILGDILGPILGDSGGGIPVSPVADPFFWFDVSYTQNVGYIEDSPNPDRISLISSIIDPDTKFLSQGTLLNCPQVSTVNSLQAARFTGNGSNNLFGSAGTLPMFTGSYGVFLTYRKWETGDDGVLFSVKTATNNDDIYVRTDFSDSNLQYNDGNGGGNQINYTSDTNVHVIMLSNNGTVGQLRRDAALYNIPSAASEETAQQFTIATFSAGGVPAKMELLECIGVAYYPTADDYTAYRTAAQAKWGAV